MRQGFNGYLAKPIDSRQLVETIREYTGFNCQPGNAHGGPMAEIRDTRRSLRPSTRQQQRNCVDIPESVRLAAGKTDLAEELFSMLLEQLHSDRTRLQSLWQTGDLDGLLECVHKLHGATRYCGVPELRQAAEELETGLKHQAADLAIRNDRLHKALERLELWSEETDWQRLFREHDGQAAPREESAP